MRTLFYLPVVTPWWFERIVEPLIRRLAAACEVHVLAPPPWQGTGIGEAQLDLCRDLPDIRWHIMSGEDHPSVRTDPPSRTQIIAFVHSLAPDYVICRSADRITPAGFCGQVRYLMEGAAPPFPIPPDWVVLLDQPFDHGCMPDIGSALEAELRQAMLPAWMRLHERFAVEREPVAFRSRADIPPDAPIIAMPLEYEHDENFFGMHRAFRGNNAESVVDLAQALHAPMILAITDHPLNCRYVDGEALNAAVEECPNVRLIAPDPAGDGMATARLVQEAAALVVGDSKAFANAAFFGTPMLRRSQFRTGDWLHNHTGLGVLMSAIARGDARGPDRIAALRWFAFHIGNMLIDPSDPALTGADIMARIDRRVDPARWQDGFARFRAVAPELFA